MQTKITVYHLEMLSPDQFSPRYAEGMEGLNLREISPPDWHWNRRMYAEVGKSYHWVNRLSWPAEKWLDYAHRDSLKTVILEVNQVPAGYFEIERNEFPSVELAYFGLVKEFIGRGLGAHLLSVAIEEAWQDGTERVWVHTCSLDHRHALRNYQKRGFQVFKTEFEEIEVAELPVDCLLRENAG